MTAEFDAAGNLTARYSQGSGIDEPLAMSRAVVTGFYAADGLGSITSLTDGTATAIATYTHDSFGRAFASTGTVTNPFQYTGREWDAETGLYYYRARYYDPNTGRFISEDPIRFKAGINLYAYVLNAPVNFIDPVGLKSCMETPAGLVCWDDGKSNGETIIRPTAPAVNSSVPAAYDAYKACTGDLWNDVNMQQCKIPRQKPNPPDFGPKDVPLDVGNVKNELALSTAKKCLRQHPLAAMDSRFNDVQPGSAF
jgi:RHS repeat-associated protein